MLITLICPFYNEADGIQKFFVQIDNLTTKLSKYDFEILCVNDGSTDETLKILLAQQKINPHIKIIDFSRNFGKEAALTAGIDYAAGDAVIPIDTDLQDPPELITEMIATWQQGFDVVLAKRTDRSNDNILKRITAYCFYHINKSITDYSIPDNVGDFRLLDRKVIEALKLLPERRRFMKGIFSWVGFKTTTIEYIRQARTRGKSKFNIWKLWNFALEGITSFSTIPLRIWTYIGATVSLLAIFYACFIIIRTLILGIDVPGYASLIVAILFMGGIQLIGIGIIGEYIGRIYYETKQRPIYIINKIYSP